MLLLCFAGRSFSLSVPSDASIGLVKVLIDEQERIAAKRQHLSDHGEKLEDDSRTLIDYHVQDGTTLLLTTGQQHTNAHA